MVFIIRGQLKSSQTLSKGMVATCILGPGNFLGDELFSWCLRRPFMDRLPASSATFICVEETEAFGLDAQHLRYITDHFRYKFANERLKRTARYYSSHWRTWAAINIQLAWRRSKLRTQSPVVHPLENGDSERRLWHYAAMFMSLRPHDHLEWKHGLKCLRGMKTLVTWSVLFLTGSSQHGAKFGEPIWSVGLEVQVDDYSSECWCWNTFFSR